MGGTRTFAGVIGFIRMTFRERQKKNRNGSIPSNTLIRPSLTPG
jgi:hypothetical protein